MLVGNKTDMSDRRQVSVEEAEKKAETEMRKQGRIVARGWAGAVIEKVIGSFGQEQ